MTRIIAMVLAAGMFASEGTSAAPKKTSPKRTVTAGIALLSIPAGSFLMGNDYTAGKTDDPVNRYYSDEQPVHRVTLGAFQMGETEVTQAQYKAAMGTNPSSVVGDDLPVTNVSANDAVAFCNKLSVSAGLEPCYDEKTWKCDFSKNGFRLPTEAEWEYACRAGSTTLFSSGSTAASLDRAGWYLGNSGGKVRPVKKKAPNAWGLYDMHGMCFEFCYEGFDETYSSGDYHAEAQTNPVGCEVFNLRIMRGGSWFSEASECRSASRSCFWTGGGSSYTGFRVARGTR